jgi:hypothetical protein
MLAPQQILAVLVTYQVDFRNCSTWQSLQQHPAAQQMHWLIYDNSGGAPLQPAPSPLLSYQHHPENPGVSSAYLEAGRLAAEKNCVWMLLLDQDSVFPPNWFERYAAAVSESPAGVLFAPIIRSGHLLLSPSRYRWGRTWPAPTPPKSPFELRQHAPINAGTLLQTNAYLRAGGHIPEVALDFSDFAFLHRFQKQHPNGHLVDLTLQHSLSGTGRPLVEHSLRRFEKYCQGAKAFQRDGGPALALTAWTIWRALLLSFRYQNVNFFAVFWRACRH